MGWLTDFAHAWRLLTAVPLPLIADDYDRPPGYSVAYYPLVGLFLGLILWASWFGLQLIFPTTVAVALVLTLWTGLTGLLHLDGLMDSCDGLLPPRDADRRLEIMKDSHAGAFGVIGVVLLLLVKYSTLSAALTTAPTALIVAPTLGRWAMTWQMFRYPPARADGLGHFFKQGLGWPQIGLATVITFITIASTLWWGHLVGATIAFAVMWLVARFALARLNGLTGDVYGATCELVETAVLLAAVAVSG